MRTFNIKRYLGTLAAALTLSVASLGAQAAALSYTYNGTVTTNPGSAFVTVDIGGSMVANFIANDGGDGTIDVGDYDESLGYGSSPDAANRSATNFVMRNTGTSIAFPGLRFGTTTSGSFTIDGTGSITGGSVALNAATPTNTFGDLVIDVDAGTWELLVGGGTVVAATGTGAFTLIGSTPPPDGGDLIIPGTPPKIPTMPPLMMVFSGLGLLLLARRHLQS